ncbi:MAG: hypothetical protein GJV46_16650 [Geobacter sp.]|nr:hypothetical protein [Geobacter sp.]
MVTKNTTSWAAKKSLKTSKEKSTVPTSKNQVKSSEELVIENFAALSQLVASLSETLDMLVQKTESMAFHIIATEEVLAEIVANNGLNIARVNSRIRAKMATTSDNAGDANRAIDVAASIVSPLPRR